MTVIDTRPPSSSFVVSCDYVESVYRLREPYIALNPVVGKVDFACPECGVVVMMRFLIDYTIVNGNNILHVETNFYEMFCPASGEHSLPNVDYMFVQYVEGTITDREAYLVAVGPLSETVFAQQQKINWIGMDIAHVVAVRQAFNLQNAG